MVAGTNPSSEDEVTGLWGDTYDNNKLLCPYYQAAITEYPLSLSLSISLINDIYILIHK